MVHYYYYYYDYYYYLFFRTGWHTKRFPLHGKLKSPPFYYSLRTRSRLLKTISLCVRWVLSRDQRNRVGDRINSEAKDPMLCLHPHPRRPRGSQSGRVKTRDESFQAWAEGPLGTYSHRTISELSRECWFLIGHKKCFVLLCPIGEQHILSSFREFVHNGFPGSFSKHC